MPTRSTQPRSNCCGTCLCEVGNGVRPNGLRLRLIAKCSTFPDDSIDPDALHIQRQPVVRQCAPWCCGSIRQSSRNRCTLSPIGRSLTPITAPPVKENLLHLLVLSQLESRRSPPQTPMRPLWGMITFSRRVTIMSRVSWTHVRPVLTPASVGPFLVLCTARSSSAPRTPTPPGAEPQHLSPPTLLCVRAPAGTVGNSDE